MQLHLTAGIAWFDACHQRAGAPVGDQSIDYYTIFDPPGGVPGDWVLAPELQGGWPRVCNAGGPGPLVNLAWSARLTEELGIGFGILAPNAVGHSQWSVDGARFTIDGGPAGVLPPPNRYNLLAQNQIALYPTIGIGYSPVDWLRVGAAFQWGIAALNFHTMTRPTVGEQAVTDVTAELDALDAFVPGIIASVHAVPIDELDIMAGFRWVDDIKAGQTTTLTYGQYGLGAGSALDSSVPYAQEITGGRVRAPQPWQVNLGFRYANRITPRPRDPAEIERLSGRVEDAMANEWFDIELDVVYEVNSKVTDIVLALPSDAMLTERFVQSGMTVDNPLPLPDRIVVPHRWNDQWSIRLGGDFNVIPGMVSLRAGFSYESSAYRSDGVFSSSNARQFAGLDFMPGQRFGVSGGLTVRLGRFDLTLAYMHLFQETLNVSPEEECLEQIRADDPEPFVPDCNYATNAGTYEVDYDAASLGVTWHM
jgi:hypothetical protein